MHLTMGHSSLECTGTKQNGSERVGQQLAHVKTSNGENSLSLSLSCTQPWWRWSLRWRQQCLLTIYLKVHWSWGRWRTWGWSDRLLEATKGFWAIWGWRGTWLLKESGLADTTLMTRQLWLRWWVQRSQHEEHETNGDGTQNTTIKWLCEVHGSGEADDAWSALLISRDVVWFIDTADW